MRKHASIMINSTLLTLLVFMLSALPALPARADETSSKKVLEEVTVTARRREESLQKVPVAVTAYSGDYLDDIGAIDITALSQSTPNTTLEVSRATNTTLTAYIRGVGQQDPVAGFEGGVGIYLDDVYLARPQATVFDIYDVERIEVLRGPQGTLYGRNTIGGAIRYVTRRLARDPEFEIKGSYGSYKQADILLKGSTPLSDTFRVGGSVASFNRDGFGKNLYTGADNADKQILAVRGSAEWEPADAWSVRFAGDYSVDKSNPRDGHRFLVSLEGDPVLKDVFDTRSGITTIPTSNAGLKQKVTQGGTSMTVEWTADDNWTLKSITAYRKDHTDSLIDFDNLPYDNFDAPVIYKNHQFSQEFQANYSSDRLSGVFGLYYLDANAFDAFDVIIFHSVTAFTLGDYDTKAWAAFFDMSWDFTDTLSLSFGGRYTSDERKATVTRETFLGLGSPYFGNDSAISITAPVPGAVPTFNGKRTDDAFTPRVSLSWAASDAQNLYVSYSEGFKGGGFDPRGAYQYPEVRSGFKPEEVKSYEAGIKSNWMDGRARTAFTVFHADYTNVQVPGSVILDTNNDGVADGFAGVTTNAGKAKIEGAEFEAVGQFTDAFSGNLAIGYVNADYTRWLVGSTDPVSGDPTFTDISSQRVFQNTPEWSGFLSLRYEWPLDLFGMQGSLAAIGSAAYKDKTYQFEIPNPITDQPSYWLYDASLVWTSDDDRYQLGLYGRNLADKEYVVASYDFPTVDNSVIGFFGNPRTVTASFTIRY